MNTETKNKLVKTIVGGVIGIILAIASVFGINVLSSCSTTGKVNSEWDVIIEKAK